MAKPKQADLLDAPGEAPAPIKIPGGKLEALLKGDAVKGLTKRFGDNILLPATKNVILTHPHFIPTGVYGLDLSLAGGVPVGIVTQFGGPKSSAKSMLCSKVVASAQRTCATCYRYHPCGCSEPQELVCAYLDVEGTSRLSWLIDLGINGDRLLYSQPGTGEEAVEITEALLRSGQCDLVVLDSVAFMQGAKEIDRDANDGTPGAQARLMADFSRRVVSSMNTMGNVYGRRPTVLTVNQVRSKVGVVFGSPEIWAGGNAIGYLNAVEIRTKKGKVEIVDSMFLTA